MELKASITIVTVVYNGEKFIEKTIQSVLSLQYELKDYIVVDGASRDNTVEIVRKYRDQLTLISEPDKGIYDAMNKAIDIAKGNWIIFMNAGDVFYSPTSLSMMESIDADVVYGDAFIQYPDFLAEWRKTGIGKFWKGLPFCHQACLVKTSIMKNLKFSLDYKLSSDFDFLYKVYLAGGIFLYSPTVICIYDFTTGASIDQNFKSLNERKRAVLSHGFSIRKWLYYTLLTLYTKAAYLFKRIVGTKLTAWITRMLRQ